MRDDFKRELLERNPTLDLEGDAPLFEGLSEKHKGTLQKQGARATAEIAGRDVENYLDSKAFFLRELSGFGLDIDTSTDRRLALDLWDERAYFIVVGFQDVYQAAGEVQREVESYLLGKESASHVADATALAARFRQRDLEAFVTFEQEQREFILAFSEFLTKALQLNGDVLEYRDDILGDPQNTISREEADELVRSPAAQLLSVDLFNEAGIPLVGHTARFVPREDTPYTLYVEPPGKILTLDSTESQRRFPFRWFTREGRLIRPLVDRSSILGRLGRLSETLTTFHPIAVEQAAYLTLCGGAIQPHSITGRVDDTNYAPAGVHGYNYSTITLTVASWMKPEQVRQAYSKLRRRATAGNTYRSRSDRNIAVFRFVLERATTQVPNELVIGAHGALEFPPWRQLVEEWNKQYPRDHRWRFNQPDPTAEKMFRKSFAASYQAVTGLKYYVQSPQP